MKKIVYILFLVILFTIFFMNILSLFNISFFGLRIYKVGSGSMEPYLKIDDIIIITKSKNYKINDVITYKNNNKEYITHRIISITNDEIITKGDANNTPDDPITKDDIVGKYIYKFRYFGFIKYIFNQKMSWLLLFVYGLIITIIIPDKKQKI